MGTKAGTCLFPHPDPTVTVAVEAAMVGPGSVGIGPVAVLSTGERTDISGCQGER